MRPRIYLLLTLPLNASIALAIFQTQTLSTCKAAVLSSAGHIPKRKVAMPTMLSAERHRSIVKTVPTPGWSEPQLVDIQSTILSRVPSVSTTKINS